jgi:beta-lactamase regulating signal transducer with metallopeptidase domain
MIDQFLGHDLVARLVGCLFDSLWQGALIALAAAALRLALPRSAPVRYWLAVAALVAMLVVPVVSFVAGVPTIVADLGPVHVETAGGMSALFAAPPFAGPAAASAFDWPQLIALAWLGGVLVCLLRLFLGWSIARTLLTNANVPVPASLARLLGELCRTLDVQGCVRLVIGEGNGAPAVVGWLRPVVWLPLAAVTGLSPEQLRVVLAHELAHIRRCDFAVNVLQRCIEALLFYHPAVWIVSATIRAEREHCCDDAALAVCSDRLVYAGALVELEAVRSGAPRLAMAASGGNLARRVRRVLGREAHRRSWRDALAVCMLTGALLAMALWQSPQVDAQASDPSPSSDSSPSPIAPPANPEVAPAPPPAAAPTAPLAPVAPTSPAAPVAPAAPAPAPNAGQDTNYFGLERPWALFLGGRTMFGGTNDDRRTASALHDSLNRDLLWFRDRGVAYMITDEATLNRVLSLFEPMEQLGRQQRELGEQQRQLGEQQRELGDQQRQLGQRMHEAAAQVPDLGPQLAELRESMAKLELGPDASPQEAAQLQAALASLQRQIGRLQGEIGREMGRRQGEVGRAQGELGRQQGELGRQQGELGRRQGELGRQQAEIARKAQRELDDLLREAVGSGLAKPAPTGV